MNTQTAMIYYGGFLKKAGGAFTHAQLAEKELSCLGWDVQVITLDDLPVWCKYLPHLLERIDHCNPENVAVPQPNLYLGL